MIRASRNLKFARAPWAAAALFGMALACPLPVSAQESPEPKRQELEDRRGDLARAEEAQKRLKAEIAAISQERARLAQELVTTATRSREIETRIAESEERLAGLTASEKDVKDSLESRREVIAELLVALQRMGRQPPPALLVRPEDALSSIRAAMLLGTVLPEIRGEAEALARELGELERLRREIVAERDGLARDQSDLETARLRIELLVEARQARQRERERELTAEQKRAVELGREVRTLAELITRMERDVAAARRAAETAAAAAPKPEPEAEPEPDAAAPEPEATESPPSAGTQLAALGNAARLTPAVEFAKARGMLPTPISGVRLKRFGEADGYGGTQRGMSFSARADASVTSPSDGWVVYAGPFRSYGQLLILNAGGGYHVLLAGMEKINVELGQFVLMGEPVGQMGGRGNRAASVVGGDSTQPVLYVEFRKDGTSIDPGPWWASSSAEKVRG